MHTQRRPSPERRQAACFKQIQEMPPWHLLSGPHSKGLRVLAVLLNHHKMTLQCWVINGSEAASKMALSSFIWLQLLSHGSSLVFVCLFFLIAVPLKFQQLQLANNHSTESLLSLLPLSFCSSPVMYVRHIIAELLTLAISQWEFLRTFFNY